MVVACVAMLESFIRVIECSFCDASTCSILESAFVATARTFESFACDSVAIHGGCRNRHYRASPV